LHFFNQPAKCLFSTLDFHNFHRILLQRSFKINHIYIVIILWKLWKAKVENKHLYGFIISSLSLLLCYYDLFSFPLIYIPSCVTARIYKNSRHNTILLLHVKFFFLLVNHPFSHPFLARAGSQQTDKSALISCSSTALEMKW